MPDRRWTLSAESITAISAVIAALIALAVGVWENSQARRHNRLSVFPSLEYVAELQVADSDSTARGTIRVVNEGVGPAIIDQVRIVLTDTAGGERVYRTWAEAIDALAERGVEVTGRAEFSEGSVMGIGRERNLLSVNFEAADDPRESAAMFTRLLEELQVVIVYHSIYGDEFRASLGPE